jgi:hypothetical protein
MKTTLIAKSVAKTGQTNVTTSVATKPSPVTQVLTNGANLQRNYEPVVLTVVVQDKTGQPTVGAKVSITPSDATKVTNSAGEAQFTLGNATHYDITASSDTVTVTVPYNIVPGGSTRMVVSPTYVKGVEAQRNGTASSSINIATTGVIIGIIVVVFIIWKLLKKRRGR